MLKEFKEFAMKGNMLDLAIGVVIGAAFGKIVDSFVKDIIMPLLGVVTPDGGTFSDWKILLGEKGYIGLGSFIDTAIQFIVIAFALFMIVKAINRMRPPAPEAPAGPTTEQLLTDIRDTLKAK